MVTVQVGGQAAWRTSAAVSCRGSVSDETPPCPSAASQEHTTIFTACSNIHDTVVKSWIMLLVGFYIFFIDKIPDRPD